MGKSNAERPFFHIGRSEVAGNSLSLRKFKATAAQRGLDALAAFSHGIVRQADDVEVLHACGANVLFNFDEIGVNAINGGAERFEEHEREGSPVCRARINQNVTYTDR